MSVPIGGIIAWWGTLSTIPGGYALCDGDNGTPDLRNKFIIGAGDSYSNGDTGGSASHSHNSGTLETSVEGAHDHSPTFTTAETGLDPVLETLTEEPDHSHTVSGSVGSVTALPPYMALYFIMRIS